MNEKETIFVQKFKEMLEAAKAMEEDGIYRTQFLVTLYSHDMFRTDRMNVIRNIDLAFLETGYRLEE